MKKLLLSLFLIILPTVTFADEPVKVGVLFGFTGLAGNWAEEGKKGIELALDELNPNGQKNIEIIYEDNRTSSKDSVSGFYNLVNIKKVKAIIGSNWSMLTNPLIPLALKSKIPLVSPTNIVEANKLENDYYYSLGNRISTTRNAANNFFKKFPNNKKLGIFCWDDAWGNANLKVWQEVAKERGIEIVETACTNDLNSDFRADTLKIISKKADIIIVAYFIDRVTKRLNELNIKLPTFTSDGIIENLRQKIIDPNLEGVYFFNWNPSNDFKVKYFNKYQEAPLLSPHNSYDSLMVIANAAKISKKNINLGLNKVTFKGATGEIDLTKNHFPNFAEASLFVVKAGKPEFIE